MTYLWRDIDAQQWALAKAKAKAEGLSMRALLEYLLKGWLNQ